MNLKPWYIMAFVSFQMFFMVVNESERIRISEQFKETTRSVKQIALRIEMIEDMKIEQYVDRISGKAEITDHCQCPDHIHPETNKGFTGKAVTN